MKARTEQPGAGEIENRIHALSPAASCAEPTVGEIKRVLHELSRTRSGCDNGSILSQANELLRQFALRSGIDPDNALQRRRAAVELRRERMVVDSVPAPDQASG
jgi:hypothetical protein